MVAVIIIPICHNIRDIHNQNVHDLDLSLESVKVKCACQSKRHIVVPI